MVMQRSVSASKAKSLFSKRSSSMSILPNLPTSFVMNVRHFGSSEEPLVKTAFYDMHLSMASSFLLVLYVIFHLSSLPCCSYDQLI